MWTLEEAQQKFIDLIDAATKEPQLIYKQNRLIAAIVEAETFQEFLVWRQQHQKLSLAEAFIELRQLCAEEDYTLEIAPRQDRPNPFTDDLHDASL